MTKVKRIIYSRGFPYGAPMVWLRGGGTRDQAVKDYLKTAGEATWWWNGSKYAYESAMYAEEFKTVLLELKGLGYEVVPKSDLDPNYVIDLG